MKTNPKKVMGRKMLLPKEKLLKTPYYRSKAWEERSENIRKRVEKRVVAAKARKLEREKKLKEANK